MNALLSFRCVGAIVQTWLRAEISLKSLVHVLCAPHQRGGEWVKQLLKSLLIAPSARNNSQVPPSPPGFFAVELFIGVYDRTDEVTYFIESSDSQGTVSLAGKFSRLYRDSNN